MKRTAFQSLSGSFAALALILAIAGCSGDQTTESQTNANVSNLTGSVQSDGSSTVQPIADAIRETFLTQFPKVNISVSGNGTGNGFKKFQMQETDVSNASRAIKASELQKCKQAGVKFIELPIAYDGLTIVVNPENDWVTELTVAQLKKMFVGFNAATHWKDIDESWPNEKINFFAPGTGSGTYDYFREVLTEGDQALSENMSLSEDDNVLVHGVATNKYSIGFFGVAYYFENRDKLRAVPIINPNDGTAYSPTPDNIAENRYAPFSRPLFLYVNSESLQRPEVQTYVEYFLDNASEHCEKVGYVRLPKKIINLTKANLDARLTGTHFVDSNGISRHGTLVSIYIPENLTE